MAVKTITITEDAYEVIKSMKMEGESFSELFKRIGEKKLKIKDVVGIMKHNKKDDLEFKKRVMAIHEDMSKDMERRIENVRSRFERSNRNN